MASLEEWLILATVATGVEQDYLMEALQAAVLLSK